jgi:hypothetical protein
MGCRVGSARALLLGFAVALVAAFGDSARAQGGEGDSWWSRNFEVHGFFQSRAYWRSPGLDLAEEFDLSSWRNELELNPQLRIFEDSDSSLFLYGVFRPVYEGVYDINPDLWGHRAHGGAVGTQSAANARLQVHGDSFPGQGSRVEDEFTLTNCDTQSAYTGHRSPCTVIDDTIFYGSLVGIWAPLGRDQPKLGGNATAETFRFASFNPTAVALQNSLAAASQPTGTPLNGLGGALGDRGSFDQAPFDVNAREWELQYDCNDNAHPWCFVREFYAEFKSGDTSLRLGKQQVVWGKTDAFRMQDIVNPIDISYHNVFPDLEERRIPQLGLDIIHSFGRVGALEDVSLEFVWMFDRFLPLQLGQCGEPYAFTFACEARADVGGHGLLNISAAAVEEVDWQILNTEPGVRLEFRTPSPSIAWSLSAFWGYSDVPAVEFKNHWSTANPNAAAILFLQGLPVPAAGGAALPAVLGVGGLFGGGFDPYNQAQVLAASAELEGLWGVFCPTVAACNASGLSVLGLPWTGSEAVLSYPRVLTLGASADYQIPGVDTVLRMETSFDHKRPIPDTTRYNGLAWSPVISAAIGLDRSTFIPFLNRDRTAFISVQQFVEHVLSYTDAGHDNGMAVPEWNLISTAFIQNYWRNDSIVLTNFAAFDWAAKAWITGPKLQYIHNEQLSFEAGVNLIWGTRQKHNIRDLCATSGNADDCIATPDTWQAGQWQALYENFSRTSESPYWGKESYADRMSENRDEVWIGLKYQF